MTPKHYSHRLHAVLYLNFRSLKQSPYFIKKITKMLYDGDWATKNFNIYINIKKKHQKSSLHKIRLVPKVCCPQIKLGTCIPFMGFRLDKLNCYIQILVKLNIWYLWPVFRHTTPNHHLYHNTFTCSLYNESHPKNK